MPSDAFVFRPPTGSALTNFDLPVPQRPGSPDMVREPDTVTPRLLKKTEPEYDEISRRARIQGSVLLYAIVGIDGVPSAVRVFHPLTPELDAQAVRAVRQWRFAPGTVKGQPSPVAVTIQLRFRMR
jgi:TonB family protein